VQKKEKHSELPSCPAEVISLGTGFKGAFFLGSSSLGRAACRAQVLCIIPGLQDLLHSTLALYKRARPCLPDFFLFTLLVDALLSASFASELPGAVERQNQKALPQPRTWKGMGEKIPPHELI
jgi:hypothetical protein